MISGSECREIAAKLRYVANDDLGGLSLQKNLAAITKAEDGSWRGVMRRLADLIDRPTCHMEGTSRSGFRCSACGEQIPPMRIFYRDSAGDHWVPMEHTRCPMCGAKVVKCDE